MTLLHESLEMNDDVLISKSSSYTIFNGIPNFVDNVNDKIQKQVQESFGEKWTQSDFGKLIHGKNTQITIPFDIELLEIKKGTYDLQRFFL